MQNELKEAKICAEKITTFGEYLAEWDELRAGPCSRWSEDTQVPAVSLKFTATSHESGGYSVEWQTSDGHYQGVIDRTRANRWTILYNWLRIIIMFPSYQLLSSLLEKFLILLEMDFFQISRGWARK